MDARFPKAFTPLFQPARTKGFYGGRGAARSWSFAGALVLRAVERNDFRVLCGREYQSSIKDSVHAVLRDTIHRMDLGWRYHITDRSITSDLGGEFIFKGMHHNLEEIKSIEGVDVFWGEEAARFSKDSLEVIRPTIRKEASELWFSWNTGLVDDPIHKELITAKPYDSVIRKVTWKDNPYFPSVLEKERSYMESNDPEAYAHVWDGETLRISEAAIFRKRVKVHSFPTPERTIFYHGADWGFAQDPTCLIRCFITQEEDGPHLWVDQEAYGHEVELDETPALFNKIETAKKWAIKGDGSRPETIRFMQRRGFNITEAKKWPGSVEDGIKHLKAFRCIHIHERCIHMQDEAKFYSYKVDRVTKEILPVVVDAHNHCWDALRYALDNFIKQGDARAIWAALAG